MTATVLADAYRLLDEAIEAFATAVGPTSSDDDLLSVPALCTGIVRRLDRLSVTTVSTLQRRGVFTERGYRNPTAAVTDLLRCDRAEARRQVVAAEQVCPRVGLDGSVNPARLPATAEGFTDGQLGLGHVDVIAKLLDKPEARRLSPEVWAGAEAELAEKATCYTPGELYAYGLALITALDQDGAEPDDATPPPVNELYLRRRRDGGGSIVGRFDDAALYDAIASLIDANAAPLTADDRRPTPQRNAEALADICGYVLDHGSREVTPERGGRRPRLNVLIRLEDLEARARAAMLDYGGGLTPESLRMLACDAAVVPIVMSGAGLPLDVGRSARSAPKGLRRAIIARDRGCAHPGCDRLPSWCEIHHLIPWELGGETTLSNTVMLCRVHHRLLHAESGWIVRITDGLPEFVPPAWIDPTRRPRRRPLPHLVTEQASATPGPGPRPDAVRRDPLRPADVPE